MERFLITDVLDDIKYPVGRNEQIASAAWLLEALGQFYFRSQKRMAWLYCDLLFGNNRMMRGK
jgi:hypothetical protein